MLLIVIMTVALAIGLSVVQKSLVDVSTASKVEQSSRAFSAAEAGIEKALTGTVNCTDCQYFSDTSSTIKQINTNSIPCVPGTTGCAQEAGVRQVAFEYPPLAKEEVAQVWLADPTATNLPVCTGGTYNICYTQSRLDVYWGNSSIDKAAIELTLVYYDGVKYTSRKWYLDQTTRDPVNGFRQVSCSSTTLISYIYQCKVTLGDNSYAGGFPLPTGLMLIRARLLYNNTSQPFAVQAGVACPAAAGSCTAYSLPPQARMITSTGTSGETQRKIQVFQEYKVAPPYFDYAIFSAGEIKK